MSGYRETPEHKIAYFEDSDDIQPCPSLIPTADLYPRSAYPTIDASSSKSLILITCQYQDWPVPIITNLDRKLTGGDLEGRDAIVPFLCADGREKPACELIYLDGEGALTVANGLTEETLAEVVGPDYLPLALALFRHATRDSDMLPKGHDRGVVRSKRSAVPKAIAQTTFPRNT